MQSGTIYGPIFSRRFGRSLGINLLSTKRKVCSFNCIYCEYGSACVVESSDEKVDFPSASDVLIAVEKAMKKPRTIEYLTLSGNGEPTLHPEFAYIVEGIVWLRNKLRPDSKMAILSNGSRITDPGVFSALQRFDMPMMKLDAGDEDTFHTINRPASTIDFDEVVRGYRLLPTLMVQSMLIDGHIFNAWGDAYEAWVCLLAKLQPIEVHIYSVERPTAEENVVSVTSSRLRQIEGDLRKRFGLVVKAFW